MRAVRPLTTLFKYVFLCCLIVFLISWKYKDVLPEAKTYHRFIMPPQQSPTERAPFSVDARKQTYQITPLYDYDLTGMIVSYSNAEAFGDIWHARSWQDFINVRDLCVIWGDNLQTGIYKKMKFSSDTWTCWAYWEDSIVSAIFQMDGLSNNHLLTNDPKIKAKLLQAQLGDVVHIKGVLAEYRNPANNFFRGSSTIRGDSGNGACETIYVDHIDIVQKVNTRWRALNMLSKWLGLISFIGFLYCYFSSPHVSRDR